jgi:hypothetical protein
MFDRDFSIEHLLTLKRRGHFRIERRGASIFVVVTRPGEPEEVMLAASPGHANQLRQALTAEGLCGYVEGAA